MTTTRTITSAAAVTYDPATDLIEIRGRRGRGNGSPLVRYLNGEHAPEVVRGDLIGWPGEAIVWVDPMLGDAFGGHYLVGFGPPTRQAGDAGGNRTRGAADMETCERAYHQHPYVCQDYAGWTRAGIARRIAGISNAIRRQAKHAGPHVYRDLLAELRRAEAARDARPA